MTTIRGSAPRIQAPAAETRAAAPAPTFSFSAADRVALMKSGETGIFKDPAGGEDIKTIMLEDPDRVKEVLDNVERDVRAWQSAQNPKPTAEQVKAKASELMKEHVADAGVSKLRFDFGFKQLMKTMKDKSEREGWF